MKTTTATLSARGLKRYYGKDVGLVRAVDGVDLDIERGETVAIMGPSGCGKSTMLHLLSGLDRPTEGEILLHGTRLDTMGERRLARLRRSDVGIVFQAFHLIDELTDAKTSSFPLCWRDKGRGVPAIELTSFSKVSASPIGLSTFRLHSRVGSANVWPSRGLWPTILPSCLPTSPRAISTAPPRSRS